MATYSSYTNIRDNDAESIYLAFGLTCADSHFVEICRGEDALSVTALGKDVYTGLSASGDGKLTFTDTFSYMGYQARTTVFGDGKVERTNQTYSTTQGLTGTPRQIPTSNTEAEDARRLVERIAAIVLPKARSLIGPSKPLERPDAVKYVERIKRGNDGPPV